MIFDWRVFLEDPGGKYSSYLQWLIAAWGWSMAVAFAGLAVALVIGFAVGVLRTLPDRPVLRWLGDAWVELFRNIPLLVQIFLWYYVFPALFTPAKAWPGFLLVVLGLGLFTSARVAEQVRTGILSLPRGQRLAALALGLDGVQVYRLVLVPLALRIVLPPLTSECMNIVKNSSVAFAVSVPELTQFAMQAQEETSRGVEIYAAVTLLYVVTALAINRVMSWLERRTAIAGLAGARKGLGA